MAAEEDLLGLAERLRVVRAPPPRSAPLRPAPPSLAVPPGDRPLPPGGGAVLPPPRPRAAPPRADDAPASCGRALPCACTGCA